jgi:hypothetical protein
MHRSLKETGFAVVTGHGLDYGLVTQVYAEWREFFLSGAADQAQYLRDLAKQDGFFNVKEAESAKGMEVKDLKQYYQLYFPHGRYPAEVSDAAQRLFAALIELGGKLLQWVDEVRASAWRPRRLFLSPMALSVLCVRSRLWRSCQTDSPLAPAHGRDGAQQGAGEPAEKQHQQNLGHD